MNLAQHQEDRQLNINFGPTDADEAAMYTVPNEILTKNTLSVENPFVNTHMQQAWKTMLHIFNSCLPLSRLKSNNTTPIMSNYMNLFWHLTLCQLGDNFCHIRSQTRHVVVIYRWRCMAKVVATHVERNHAVTFLKMLYLINTKQKALALNLKRWTFGPWYLAS